MSIIPRGKGLGYAQYLPKEQYLYSKEQVSMMDITGQYSTKNLNIYGFSVLLGNLVDNPHITLLMS